MLKDNARATAIAVRGFNVEIARIAEQVTQDTTGQMRLKFWDDTVDKCYMDDYTKVPQHPVAIELYKVLTIDEI